MKKFNLAALAVLIGLFAIASERACYVPAPTVIGDGWLAWDFTMGNVEMECAARAMLSVRPWLD